VDWPPDPSGAPWLLIEMCVLVAVYGSVGGVFLRAIRSWPTRPEEEQVDQAVAQGWAGFDVGKGHHWVCLIDESGATLWSRKAVNDEAAIIEAIGEVLSRARQVSWAVDITGTSSALLLALRAAHGQQATYVPGRTVNQMSTAYIGEAKTDARDAYVIAETVRHRGDLTPVDVPAALVTELRLLVTHRTDLVADRVRLINRLRDVLSDYFPALEREFDYSSSRGAVVLLTGYQTPAAIRGRGRSRLTSWLTARKVRNTAQVATLAVAAADARHATVPGQDVAASILADTRYRTVGARPAPPRPGNSDRCDLPRPPAGRDPRVHACGCPASASSSAPSSSPPPPPATSAATPTPGTSPPPPAWSPSRGTPADAPATCTARCGTPASCDACSTCPRSRR